MTNYVSVNSNWVHPPGNPRRLVQKNLPRGSGFYFWKLPGGGEFDKGRNFVENESETQKKNSVDQIFTSENIKQVEFFTFFEVYVFS